MLNKIPILRSLKNDHWVKPFLKRYKKDFDFGHFFRNFDLCLWGRIDVLRWLFN